MEYFDSGQIFKKAMERLNERFKELNCLYHIHEVLNDDSKPLDMVFYQVLEKIPPGWQHPLVCEARIIYEGNEYKTAGFRETPWAQQAELVADNHVVGRIEVIYTQLIRMINNSQFLPEEQKLLNTIADDLSDHIFFRRLKKSLELISSKGSVQGETAESILGLDPDEHWKWRLHMAELIASRLDGQRFGVKGIYLIGSTKEATSGPGSDIDLLVHLDADERQQCELRNWFEGWSLCLDEMNYLRTGYSSDGLLDVHYITDKDISENGSFASMIGAVSHKARPLKMKTPKAGT